MSKMPEGWTAATLADVAEWGSGGTPLSSVQGYYGGNIPWAVIGDLTDGPVCETKQHITSAGLGASAAKIVQPGTILIAMYGSIGKLGISALPMATNQAIAFAVPRLNVIDRDFLFWYLRSQRERLNTAGKGATQQNISQTVLKAWPIAIPPLAEQRRIVAALEAVSSRLEVAEQSISRAMARADRLLQIDARALGGFSSEARRLDDVAHVITGKTPSTKEPRFWGDSIPFVTPGDFEHRQTVRRASRSLSPAGVLEARVLPPGSTLLTCIGATIGKTAFAEVRCVTNQQINALIPKTDLILCKYLFLSISSPKFLDLVRSSANSTTLPILNKRNLGALCIEVPSIDEQQRIVSRWENVSTYAWKVQSEAKRTHIVGVALRNGVLSEAFSGRLTKKAGTITELKRGKPGSEVLA